MDLQKGPYKKRNNYRLQKKLRGQTITFTEYIPYPRSGKRSLPLVLLLNIRLTIYLEGYFSRNLLMTQNKLYFTISLYLSNALDSFISNDQ